jgi:hypothetical protein
MSSRLDKSQTGRTQRLKQKAVAVFYNANPATAVRNLDPSTLLLLQGGRRDILTFDLSGTRVYDAGCCPDLGPGPDPCVPPDISGFQAGILDQYGFTFPSGGDGSELDPYYYDASWNPVEGATSYILTSTLPDGTIPDPSDNIVVVGTTGRITTYFHEFGEPQRIFTLTAITDCGVVDASLNIFPCFLAGSLVQMADGSQKAIEDVCVGDAVLGAFGETNMILALHRPLLGAALMCKINGEHSTTNHHPHISVDRKFYCGNPALVSGSTYGHFHKVIDAAGAVVDRMLHGLKKERILPLSVGVELKTVEGSRTTKTLETYSMPADTQLYNLVVGGSHTYHVDGYAVTGWPREDDFDYDTWTAL